jgi:hypothetical protein
MTPPKNLAASVHARLLTRAKAEGRPFDEVLTYYAIERFLFRLSRTSHRDRFVLKGALMLPLWGTALARATRDIDFLGIGALTTDQLAGVITDCLTVELPPDAINFDASTIAISEIRDDMRYGGIRARFLGYLERARINMQVDVGLGAPVTPGVVAITYPALLDLPGTGARGLPGRDHDRGKARSHRRSRPRQFSDEGLLRSVERARKPGARWRDHDDSRQGHVRASWHHHSSEPAGRANPRVRDGARQAHPHGRRSRRASGSPSLQLSRSSSSASLRSRRRCSPQSMLRTMLPVGGWQTVATFVGSCSARGRSRIDDTRIFSPARGRA